MIKIMEQLLVLNKFFDDVMKDENIITFQDIAYAPYNKPKIYIL